MCRSNVWSRVLSPSRTLNRTPIFQVVRLERAAGRADPLRSAVTPEPGEDLRLRFDIELHVEHAGAVDLHWLFKRDLFERESIERLAHVRANRDAGDGAPGRAAPVFASARCAEPPDRCRAVQCNRPRSRSRTIAALFEAQVVRTPEVAALTCGDASLSYDELNTRANHLAHDLIAAGIGPERIVGVTLERSIDLVVSLLAIIKAGGAYAPIDPDLPAARLSGCWPMPLRKSS